MSKECTGTASTTQRYLKKLNGTQTKERTSQQSSGDATTQVWVNIKAATRIIFKLAFAVPVAVERHFSGMQ